MQHPKNPFLGKYIWDVFSNDKTQRDVLAAALKAIDDPSQPAKKVLWAIDAANRLSVYRNDIIHSAMSLRLGEKGPTTQPSYLSVSLGRFLRIGDKNMEQVMRFMASDAMRLSRYVFEIARGSFGLGALLLLPSPRRPRLRTLLLFQGAPKKARVRRSLKGRSSPPR
jgi:hypothetical protein